MNAFGKSLIKTLILLGVLGVVIGYFVTRKNAEHDFVPQSLGDITAQIADESQYPTDDEWNRFSELKGKSWRQLVALFGKPVEIKHHDADSEWIYPWYYTAAFIDSEGTIADVVVLGD